MTLQWLYALSVVVVGLTLPIFSYLTLIYRELGRMTTGRVHEHLEILEAAESLARISEQEAEKSEEQRTEEGIEALVEVAEEEGIIEPEQADLIEQVVEFSDKRVREVMTPRPDIVALAAEATLEEFHAKVVETKFSKIPVYEKSLDDIFGVVFAQALLQIADADLPKR